MKHPQDTSNRTPPLAQVSSVWQGSLCGTKSWMVVLCVCIGVSEGTSECVTVFHIHTGATTCAGKRGRLGGKLEGKEPP
jgi:hypothetical protein